VDGVNISKDLCTTRKAHVRLPEKENSNSHGATPVNPIISMVNQQVVDEEVSLVLLSTTYQSNDFSKSTPPQNRQPIVYYY
jgi:hypothetical protein